MGQKTASESLRDGLPRTKAGTTERRRASVVDALLGCDALVTVTPAGRWAATIALHGELCAATAPELRDVISRTIDGGVSRLVIDLADLRLCTSHGLDEFDRAHRHLAGAVRVENAHGVVDRVLSIIEDADPTFPALRRTRSALRGSG